MRPFVFAMDNIGVSGAITLAQLVAQLTPEHSGVS